MQHSHAGSAIVYSATNAASSFELRSVAQARIQVGEGRCIVVIHGMEVVALQRPQVRAWMGCSATRERSRNAFFGNTNTFCDVVFFGQRDRILKFKDFAA